MENLTPLQRRALEIAPGLVKALVGVASADVESTARCYVGEHLVQGQDDASAHVLGALMVSYCRRRAYSITENTLVANGMQTMIAGRVKLELLHEKGAGRFDYQRDPYDASKGDFFKGDFTRNMADRFSFHHIFESALSTCVANKADAAPLAKSITGLIMTEDNELSGFAFTNSIRQWGVNPLENIRVLQFAGSDTAVTAACQPVLRLFGEYVNYTPENKYAADITSSNLITPVNQQKFGNEEWQARFDYVLACNVLCQGAAKDPTSPMSVGRMFTRPLLGVFAQALKHGGEVLVVNSERDGIMRKLLAEKGQAAVLADVDGLKPVPISQTGLQNEQMEFVVLKRDAELRPHRPLTEDEKDFLANIAPRCSEQGGLLKQLGRLADERDRSWGVGGMD